jgi:hypothetical protein
MKIKFKDGKMLFVRYGPMNAQYQNNEKAPTRRGIWAFPFPYVELYFVEHTNTRLLPMKFNRNKQIKNKMVELKRVLTEDEEMEIHDAVNKCIEENIEEYEKKCKTIRNKLNKPKKFWYKGRFYCHFHPATHVCVGEFTWYEWDNMREFAKVVDKYTGSSRWYDDLEIFIPM